MKYYVYDTYNTDIEPKEFDNKDSVRVFIDDKLNGNPNRKIENITVIKGTKLQLETREVIVKETTITEPSGNI